MADKWGLPLQWIQKRTSSSEFVRWMVFYEKKREGEIKETTKLDHYLAQISMLLDRLYQVKLERPKIRKAEEFVIPFNFVDDAIKKEDEEDPEEVDERSTTAKEDAEKLKLAWTKTKWLGITGILDKKKK